MIARHHLTIVLALVSAVSLTSCAERFRNAPDGDPRHFDRTFSVAPGGTLTLKTDAGSVEVKGSDGNEVKIAAEMRGSQRDLDRFQVSAEASGNNVDVRGKFRDKPWGGVNNFDARFVISVPKSYNLELHTSGGNVEVVGVKGSLAGGTSGGNVRVKDIEGTVKMGTSGGDVEAIHVNGPVNMETSGGNVRAEGLTGNAQLHTSGGNVNIEGVDGEVDAGTSGGNVSIKLTGQNKGIHAETSGGTITLFLSRSVAADVDLSTSGGSVSCDMPVTISGRIREDNIRGTLNGGGPVISAHTSGGDVRVRPLQ